MRSDESRDATRWRQPVRLSSSYEARGGPVIAWCTMTISRPWSAWVEWRPWSRLCNSYARVNAHILGDGANQSVTSSAPSASPAGQDPPSPAPRRPVVLIVDDDPDVRAICTWYLEASGCDVLTARDGALGFDQAKSQLPDVIVMDLAMPGVDGWAAIAALKSSVETGRIPIIALTAVEAARVRARSLGCSAFLAKPCLPDLLLWQIRTLLRPAPPSARRPPSGRTGR